MSERFHIPASEWNPDVLVLRDAEAHHCADVMRGKPGDKITVFNGDGIEASTEIVEANKREVILKTLGVTKSEPLRSRLVLGQAIPKGKNMDLIVQKATELGVAEIVPFLSERTVVRLDPDEATRKQEKWQRVALEACKQSGQNWLPTVHQPQSIAGYLGAANGLDLKLIASLQPNSRGLREILAEHEELNNAARPESALILIGPEGDFTPAEIHEAESHGCLPMTLGPIILRTETAAIFSLSVLAYELLS